MIPPEKIQKYRKVYQLFKKGSTPGERNSAQNTLKHLESKYPGIEQESLRVSVQYKVVDAQNINAGMQDLNEALRKFEEALLNLQASSNILNGNLDQLHAKIPRERPKPVTESKKKTKLTDKIFKSRYYLGTYFKIPMYLDYTFLIMVATSAILNGIANGISGFLYGILVYVALGAIIVAHEYGHAWAAKYYKIETKSVVLYFFGGIASIEREPAIHEEILIAFAGPLVNFVLAGLTIILSVTTGLGNYEFMGWFVDINLFVGLFNLFFLYPLDGSRILRAGLGLLFMRSGLSEKQAYFKATKTTLTIGRPLAWLFLLIGIVKFLPGFIILSVLCHMAISYEKRRLQNPN